MLVQLLSHGIQFECIWWWFLLTLSFVLDLYCPGADAASAYISYRKRQNSQTPVNLRISTDELFSVCCCYWMEGWNLDQATFPDMDEFLGGIRHEKLKNQSSCNPRVITMCAGSAAYWQPCGVSHFLGTKILYYILASIILPMLTGDGLVLELYRCSFFLLMLKIKMKGNLGNYEIY